MFFRTNRSLVSLLTFFAFAGSLAPLAAETSQADEAEAQQLYARANDYVAHIGETGFSYAYIQFYWKRAQANLDRIVRVYPQTAIGRQLRSKELKIGPFELPYFKDRVLPRLEEKKVAAYDPVNCAIFLYNLDEKRNDPVRTAAMQSIIEVLCRQKRWNEALAFPVLDEQRVLLRTTVFTVAARYGEKKVMKDLQAKAKPAEIAGYWPILGEAMAFTGVPRKEINAFIIDHPEPDVRLAILSAMAKREIGIQRAATLHLQVKDSIPTTHYALSKLSVRDDVEAVAKTFFPQPTAESQAIVARYRAALGQKPQGVASVDEHLAYLEYLAVMEKWGELTSYVNTTSLDGRDRQTCELKTIELSAGRAPDSAETSEHRSATSAHQNDLGEAATFAEFRGEMNAPEGRLTVREHTFSDLKLKDPCVLAQLILEWALTPTRSIRGAAPWDSVVQSFLPGFDDLPLPKSKAVQEAAGSSKPF